MDLLALVNRLRIEVSATGDTLSGLSNAALETRRMRNWIIQADLEIQALHYNWEFLRNEIEFQTIANQGSYMPVTDIAGIPSFAEWKRDSARIYHTTTGYGSETFLGDAKPYDAFRDYYLFNARRTAYARPIVWAIGPDKKLWLGPAPNDTYTVVAEYYREPKVLDLDTDTPLMPTRFQMVIVYKAMQEYGAYEAAPEVLARGQQKYKEMLDALTGNQLPSISFGGPLA